jgi:transcriptional regulator with XRE-family HTH domain
MSKQRQQPGTLWALVQEWMDSIPYPPSQRKLAARLGVSPSAVSDWKYGEGFPDPDSLHRLAAEIGVPYERVLDAVLKDRGYREDKREERRGTA